MDTRCTGDTCKGLQTQTGEEAMKCTKSQVVNDDVDGCKLQTFVIVEIPF
jgi:hypothetical protein